MPENGSVNGGAGRDAPDRPDSNDRGGAREEKEGKAAKADSFDRALDNANRPDRSSAAPPETTKVADIDNQNDNATDKTENQSERAAGPPGIGAPPSSPAHTDTDKEMTGNASFSSHRGYGTPFDVPDAPTIPEENDKHPEAAHQTDATNIIGVAGYATAGGQAAIDMPKRAIDHFARHRAAQTLTRGNAGSLPVPGSEYANRADLGKAIKDTRITVDDALGKTPYGPNAQSTQQLNAATKPVSALGAAAKTVGWGLQPAVGALQGYQKTPEDAGIAQTGLNMTRAAVKEFDDTAVSYGAGTLAAGAVTLGSASTGPAAPAVAIAGAPAAGMAAGVGMGQLYNDSLPDKAFDKGVDAVFDGIESVVDTVGDAFGYVGSQIDQWETNITEQVVRRTARGARD